MVVDVEDPGRVFGPFHVATEPIQRLGDPAQHVSPVPRRSRRGALAAVAAAFCRRGGRRPGIGAPLDCRLREPLEVPADEGHQALAGLPCWRQHPGVLGPPSLARIDHQAAARQSHAGQAARHHPHSFPVVDGERTEVDVARFERFAHVGRGRRERDDALGDPTSRVGQDLHRKVSELLARACGPMTSP